MRSSDGAAWRRMAALTIAYAAAMAYSLFLAGATHDIAVIWTANAIAVAGLLTLGRRHAVALLAATSFLHVVLGLIAGDSLVFELTITALDAGQEIATAAVLRALRLPTRLRNMRDLLVLTGVATTFTAASSLVVNGLLSLSGGGGFWTGWNEWVSCNTAGMAVMLPMLLVLMDRRHDQGFPARTPEAAGHVALVAAISLAVYIVDAPVRQLLFAPALVAVFRGGPRAAAAAVTASMAVAIPAVLYRTGLDPAVALPPLRYAQAFHVVLYMVCMAAALALGRQARLQALLVRRTEAARAAEARAQAANRAKSEFLATMSHEIRTPLNSVLGFAGLVAEDPDLSPENRRRLELVGRAGRSLADLVDDLLDFSRIEAGRVELNLGAASPAALLQDAVAIVAPAAEAKGLALSVEVEAQGAADADRPLSLDEARLRQVLLNLLSNAVKFTPAGHVAARLLVGPGPGALRFEVSDTGIGISPEAKAKLFQRFSQADSSISRSYGGTGLGLAISKALIRQMGGDIGVDSAPGQGSRFWVTLTAEPAAASSVSAASPRDSDAGAARVLLVDDHPMNRELGEALLTLAGCVVTTADDGAHAVEAVRRSAFDVVLMDVHMPGMDGLAATRAIRALPPPAGRIPIVALTADALPEQVARCRAAGMNDHVSKPIRRELLLEAVARALGVDGGDERPACRHTADA